MGNPNRNDLGIPVIKITYSDEVYEIFNHDSRKQNMSGENGAYDYAYIGTFDEVQFNALLQKYMQGIE